MKKTVFSIVIFLIVQATAPGQSCLPEGITFTTQEQIDNFQMDFPGCTEIEGDVLIKGTAIKNLNGLSILTSIGGNLRIGNFGNPTHLSSLAGLDSLIFVGGNIFLIYNDSLTLLSGLANLTTINGSITIYNNGSLVNLAGLDYLTFVEGNLIIFGNYSLKSLSGLGNLNTIGGNLEIKHTRSLGNLNGLENLTTIGNDLYIFNNNALNSLSGLENLTSIGADLRIERNDSLTSLSALNNLNASTIENLSIIRNKSLTNCAVEVICNYLAAPNGTVKIYYNASGCNNPPEIADECGFVMSCLPFGDYYFVEQIQIDSFQFNYPGCNEVAGLVKIGGDINNLNGLNGLSTIKGNLEIYFTQILGDLVGLDNITSIDGNFEVYSNISLKNFKGIGNLSSIGGNFQIGFYDYAPQGMCMGNPFMTSLSGLDKLTIIGGALVIECNDSLTNLSGLDSLTSIGNYLYIYDNASLSSLTGIDNIAAGSIGDLTIYRNFQLTKCDVQSICDYLSSPNGEILLSANAPGCDNLVEVEEACIYFVDELPLVNQLSIRPNPFSTSTTISYNLHQPTTVQITIYNHLGKQVEVIQQKQTTGKQQVEWNAQGLPSGIYYFTLQAGEQMASGKMVVVR